MKDRIRSLGILALIQLLAACAANPQISTNLKGSDNVKPAVAEEQKPMMAFGFPPEVIQQARDRYIELNLLRVAPNGIVIGKQWNGSAGLIDSSHALTNFHVLHDGQVTVEAASGLEYSIMESAPSNYPADLIVFTTSNPDKLKLNLPPIRLAKEVIQGEILANYSNANGESGFLDYFVVSKIKDDGTFLVSRPFKVGASGSLLYNSLGEVVGMVKQVMMKDGENGNYPVYGIAIHCGTMTGYIKSIAPFLKAYDDIRKQIPAPPK